MSFRVNNMAISLKKYKVSLAEKHPMTFAFTESEKERFLLLESKFTEIDCDTEYNILFTEFYSYEGCIEGVEWALEIGSVFSEYCILFAACKGSLEVVKWLKDQGSPMTSEAINQAEQQGHCEVVKWLRENKCPRDL